MSKFDYLYRSVLLSRVFTKGWGNPDNLKRLFNFRKILSNRETCQKLVSSDYPIHIDKDEMQKECRVLQGHFVSPFIHHVPGIMPEEVQVARFEMILPKKWTGPLKPVCLHLAGTGDHGFWRRRVLLARPLLKEAGIASILLENPYYGCRKPKKQLRSSLHNVSDLFVMGGALVLESLALFHWCENQGYGPLGITGISMGGHMASLAATNWHRPLSLVPCLSWSTASTVFTQGVLSSAVPWKLLENQFFEDGVYNDEVSKLISSPEENFKNKAFLAGQEFSRNYPNDLKEMAELREKYEEQDSVSRGSKLHEDHNKLASQSLEKVINREIRENCEHSEVISDTMNTASVSSDHVMTSQTDVIHDGFRPERGHQPPDKTRHRNVGSAPARYHTASRSARLDVTSYPGVRLSSTGTSAESEDLWAWRTLERITNRMLSRDNKQKGKSQAFQKEALDFMRGLMDECTHLGNFSTPVDTELIIIIAAKSDAYIPRDSVLSLVELWPGAEVRYVDTGHIGAFLFKQTEFRKGIIHAFDRQIKKYYT